MLVFNEGLPRSGKSYDTILNHIVPALRKGRRVFARLNGMDDDGCRDAIAAWIDKPRAYVDAMLVHVATADVPKVFSATLGEGKKWSLDDGMRNALVVIDEVHEFWVGGTRAPMPPENEQFFALHGHYGIDVLVMSQHYKRTHTAIRYRVERKNVFQKLSALGSKGEKMYRQTYYQTVAPDKYERVGGETKSYDPKVFALYHGVVPGKGDGESGEAVGQDVYEGGRTTLWRSMAVKAVIFGAIGIAAVGYLISFFTGGASLVAEGPMTTESGPVQVQPAGPAQVEGPRQVEPTGPRQTPAQLAAMKKEQTLQEMTNEQRYVWNLGDKARIRLAATIGEGEDTRGIVEWIDGSQIVIERLTLDQLRAMGVRVVVEKFGVRLEANGQGIVATGWPYTAPQRDADTSLYDTSGGVRGPSASEAPAPAAVSGGTAIAYRGQLPVGAGGGGAP